MVAARQANENRRRSGIKAACARSAPGARKRQPTASARASRARRASNNEMSAYEISNESNIVSMKASIISGVMAYRRNQWRQWHQIKKMASKANESIIMAQYQWRRNGENEISGNVSASAIQWLNGESRIESESRNGVMKIIEAA
jgi:hypothetical protein